MWENAVLFLRGLLILILDKDKTSKEKSQFLNYLIYQGKWSNQMYLALGEILPNIVWWSITSKRDKCTRKLRNQ